MKKIIGILLLVLVGMAGCKQKSASSGSPDSKEVYQGVIPCADCAGIDLTVTFDYTNNDFEEKMVYLNTDGEFVSKGKFDIERGFENEPDAVVFILNRDKPVEEQNYYMYYSADPTTLYKLDIMKKKIDSDLNYSLKKK